MSDHRLRANPVVCLRWAARVWAALAALFWGTFLVEHLAEWVFRAEHRPPAGVWLALGLHAAMIAGLMLGWRWELAGGAVGVTAAILFLAGRSKPDVAPLLMLATVVPGCVWLAIGGYEWGVRTRSESAGFTPA
jgi:hypothetical protein